MHSPVSVANPVSGHRDSCELPPEALNPLRLRGHVAPLDGLRGLAIILVLLVHFTPPGNSHTLVGALTKAIASAGSAGVDLFFVLSGFLITGILLDAKGSPRYFRTFYARRALRIFPLYYMILFMSFVVVPWVLPSNSPEHQWLFSHQTWLWLYASNIKTAMGTAVQPFSAGWLQLDHFWSLAIEEQFYLIWPLLVLLLSRRKMIFVCVALLAVGLGIRSWLYFKGDQTMAFYTFTPCRMDELAMGGLLALVSRDPRNTARIMKVAPVAFVITGVALFATWETDLRAFVMGGTMLGVFFAALLALVVAGSERSPLRRIFELRILRLFGRYSYAMYVLHPFLLAAMAEFISYQWLGKQAHSGPVGVFLFLLIGFAATLAAGWTSWNLWEKHFLKLKRHFEYKPTTS